MAIPCLLSANFGQALDLTVYGRVLPAVQRSTATKMVVMMIINGRGRYAGNRVQ